jgi:hypothetical protein
MNMEADVQRRNKGLDRLSHRLCCMVGTIEVQEANAQEIEVLIGS